MENSDLQNSKRSTREKLGICLRYLQNYVPITSWLPNYRWKEYFFGDLMGGLTLGFLHVPQALAFAMLAEADPVMGLYTACFPVFVYCIFGTASISAYGPTAVSSLLVKEAIDQHGKTQFTNDQVVVIVTFLIGVHYLLAYILRLAVITKLFTKPLTSALIAASACQVILSTVKVTLGLKLECPGGYFRSIINVYDLFNNISDTNLVTLSLSVSILIVFIVNTFVFKPLMKKCTDFIIPIEVIVVILVTLISFFLELHRLDVQVIGFIPNGLPEFTLPEFRAVHIFYIDALLIFMTTFTGAIVVAMIFNADLRPEQEFLALGISNIFGSMLHTMPLNNSLVRTIIAQSCGTNTLLSSIISSSFLILVILLAGPLLYPLPHCVLGCIIIYSLSVLVVKTLMETPEIIKSGLENAIIWCTTASVTFFISIELGIAIGFTLTLRQFLSTVKDSEEIVI